MSLHTPWLNWTLSHLPCVHHFSQQKNILPNCSFGVAIIAKSDIISVSLLSYWKWNVNIYELNSWTIFQTINFLSLLPYHGHFTSIRDIEIGARNLSSQVSLPQRNLRFHLVLVHPKYSAYLHRFYFHARPYSHF